MNCDAHEAFIGYDNLLIDGTVTTSSEDTVNDFHAANLTDWFTWDEWRPLTTGVHHVTLTLGAGEDCDYFAYYAPNLPADATVTFQTSTDGITWVNFSGPHTGKGPRLELFPSINRPHFRIEVNFPTSIDGGLAVVSFGQSMQIETGLRVGFEVPRNGMPYKILNNISEQAAFIGRSRRAAGVPITIDSDGIEYQWMIDQWRPFVEHASAAPWFFSWSTNRYPDETAFCFTGDDFATPSFEDSQHSQFSIAAIALIGSTA